LAAEVFAANRIPVATEAAILSVSQKKQVSALWSWLSALESVQDERAKYIMILEKEMERLKNEIHGLVGLPFFSFTKRPNRGDLVKITRPLNRFWKTIKFFYQLVKKRFW
jgi:hypothetical protein